MFVFALVAMTLLAPSLILGAMVSHSSPQNQTWATQFAEQFRAGNLYPRWLYDSFDGLGGPAFYFYPPLPFWLDSVVDALTFHQLAVRYRLAVDWCLLLWASGIVMQPWLKAVTGSARTAYWGAIAYMAAPYHLLDHYTRGAFAEFTGFVALPALFLAILRISEEQRGAALLLALAYAALLLLHLPTALLISIAALPPYVAFRTWRLRGKSSGGFLLRCMAGGILGLGLAAIYVLPASFLQSAISADQLWTPEYSPETWFLLMPERWIGPLYTMLIVASVAGACFVAALGSLVALRVAHGEHAEAVFWACLSLLEIVLMSGLVPWFWTWVPLVSKVQFPWRLLVLVEFATITALCFVPWRRLGRLSLLLFGAAIVALMPGLKVLGYDIISRVLITLSDQPTPPPQDVKEYLPSGYPIEPKAGYAQLGIEPLRDMPPIVCTPAARTCRIDNDRFGDTRIKIENDQSTKVTLRKFFFPAWALTPPTPLAATEGTRLLSFTAEPGAHSYVLKREPLPIEKVGWLLSAGSLAMTLFLLVKSRRRIST